MRLYTCGLHWLLYCFTNELCSWHFWFDLSDLNFLTPFRSSGNWSDKLHRSRRTELSYCPMKRFFYQSTTWVCKSRSSTIYQTVYLFSVSCIIEFHPSFCLVVYFVVLSEDFSEEKVSSFIREVHSAQIGNNGNMPNLSKKLILRSEHIKLIDTKIWFFLGTFSRIS